VKYLHTHFGAGKLRATWRSGETGKQGARQSLHPSVTPSPIGDPASVRPAVVCGDRCAVLWASVAPPSDFAIWRSGSAGIPRVFGKELTDLENDWRASVVRP